MAPLLHSASALFGVLTALYVLAAPKLGRRSGWLVAHLLPASFGAGVIAAIELAPGIDAVAATALALAATTCSLPGAALFTSGLAAPRRARLPVVASLVTVLLAAGWLAASWDAWQASRKLLQLGLWGHLLGGALLVCAILVLVSIEQVLRGAREPERWRIKLPLVGLGLTALAGIFLATELLLYQSIGIKALSLFAVAFLVSTPLIAIGWIRASGPFAVRLSQQAVYGGLTLVAVGVYLILASLFVWWVGSLASTGAEAGAFAFLLAIAFLVTALLSTQVRHEIRSWVRRNLFRGGYDYRAYWLEAEERIPHNQPPEQSAAALAGLIHRAVGSIEIGVWLRITGTDRFRLACRRGNIDLEEGEQAAGLLAALERVDEAAGVIPVAEEPHPGLRGLCRRAAAELLMPLRSENRTLGFVTIGPNRSGRPFDFETHEFLRVLGRHAARELHKHDLMDAQLQAREAHAFQSFATFLLHDLKNFASTLSLVARNAVHHGENPAFLRDAFDSVLDTAEKMKRLCNSLRTFSQPPRHVAGPGDLNRTVREVLDELAPSLSVVPVVSLAELPRIPFDADSMASLVRNLVLNASEAVAAGGRIEVETAADGDALELTVRDDGAGIAREFFERDLFVPFRTTKSAGLGIGLFQCKRTAEAHGGTIEVESREGAGTTVRVRLPLDAARSADRPDPARARETTRGDEG